MSVHDPEQYNKGTHMICPKCGGTMYFGAFIPPYVACKSCDVIYNLKWDESDDSYFITEMWEDKFYDECDIQFTDGGGCEKCKIYECDDNPNKEIKDEPISR